MILRLKKFALAALCLCSVTSRADEAAAWSQLVASANWMEEVYADVAVMAEVLMLIKREFVEERDARELMYGAIHGMVESLDAHSVFLEADDFAEVMEEVEGSFYGVGISATMQEGEPVVETVKEGSPAEQAGILPGDRIVSVDGKATQGMTMKDVIRAFRGPLGTVVRMSVVRDSEAFEFALARGEIPLKSVWPQMPDNGVAVVRVSQFTEKTAGEFGKAVEALKAQGASALVLDLRDNPGGVVDAAVDVADCFLPAGTEVVSLRGRNATLPRLAGVERMRWWGRREPPQVNWPMVVLVNEKTASAAEILAGALQDHKRAVIIGERTFGKASVQQVVRLRLRPEVGVRLTVARYFTPNGRMIQGEGIAPDIVVGSRKSEVEKDEALERALEILKAAKIFLKETK